MSQLKSVCFGRFSGYFCRFFKRLPWVSVEGDVRSRRKPPVRLQGSCHRCCSSSLPIHHHQQWGFDRAGTGKLTDKTQLWAAGLLTPPLQSQTRPTLIGSQSNPTPVAGALLSHSRASSVSRLYSASQVPFLSPDSATFASKELGRLQVGMQYRGCQKSGQGEGQSGS